jgi:hypothetical protein
MMTPTFEAANTTIDGNEHPSHTDKPLDPNAILVAEFEYIAQSLFQTNRRYRK